MRTIKSILYFLFFCTSIVQGQTFSTDTIQYTGDPSARINLVILGDGYTQDQLGDFDEDAQSFINELFQYSPYTEYQTHFNIFTVRVPSNESGADHPGTADDEGNNPQNVGFVDTYFDSTFDAAGIHRLLTCNNGAAFTVAANHFIFYDQVIMLVNSQIYGGSGGPVATSSQNAAANLIAIHELGHSFASLADEYWSGFPFNAANMTQESDPSLVSWKNWIGFQGVDIHEHCCGNGSSTWFKPHENCMMEALSNPFCSVCEERTVETIHELTYIIQDHTPFELIQNISSAPFNFQVENLSPVPNTLHIIWELNGEVIAEDVESLELQESDLVEDMNFLRYLVEDVSPFLRIDNHVDIHAEERTWVINGVVDNENTINNIQVDIFPNPASANIYIQFDGDLSFRTRLYNLKGQLIQSFENRKELDVSDVAEGIYLLEVKDLTSDKMVVEKIVISR